MPDPVLYTQAMTVAAVVSALCALATGWARSSATTARVNLACIIGLGLGLIAGYRVLHVRCGWPPVNGLDRFLTIVLPLIFSIELVACWPRLPLWIAWCLRIGLVGIIPRILLRGSIYLGGPGSAWTRAETYELLLLSSLTLAVVWWFMSCLSRRSPGVSILLALALSTQTAAISVMLAGYVTGGAAALPLTSALIGVSIAASLLRTPSISNGGTGIGVMGLFGLLFVGRFFGGLSTPQTLAIFLAPLLCWVSEIPLLTRQQPWQRAVLRLGLVAIPLIIVLALAKRSFDRDTAPLLSAVSSPFYVLTD